jgi:hypothetical protein
VSIARGILRIARFRADGLAEFEASRHAFLNSLAPLVAFPVAGAVLELVQGQVFDALVDLLASLVALLAPLVISEVLAERWGVGERWLGYAVASNWAQWTMPMVLAAMLTSFWLLDALGMVTDENMVTGGAIGVLLYGLALHWFLARNALGLSRWRSAGLVAACDIGTVLLVLGPRLIALHF